MRSHRISRDDMTYSLGLKIVEHSAEYEEYFKVLFMKRMGMI
jgi:hypothetical protein